MMALAKILVGSLLFAGLMSFQMGPITDCTPAEALVATPNDDLNPQLSPDGSRIAFVGHHEGNPEVYVQEITSGVIRNLSNAPEDDYQPLWSPDGKYIAFFRRPEPYYSQHPKHLMLVELNTGTLKTVSETAGELHSVSWSADSQQLFYALDKGFLVYDVQKQANRDLYRISYDTLPSFYFGVTPSPDGQWVVIQPNGITIDGYVIHLIDVNSGNQEQIFAKESYPLPVIWSPDSQQFAFTAGGFPAEIILHIYDVQTRDHQEIFTANNASITLWGWSPDNQLAWSVHTTKDRETISQLWILEDTPRQLLQINHGIGQAVWSPTHNHIAFRTFAGLYVVDVQSSVFRDFVQGLGYIRPFVWSPDGNWLAAELDHSFLQREDAVVITDIRSGAVYRYGAGEKATSVESSLYWTQDNRHLIFAQDQYHNTGTDIVRLEICSS